MGNYDNSCNCKQSRLPGCAVMIGLIVLGIFIAKGLGKIAQRDQYVTVKGLAEREVMANKVTWTIPYYCVDNDIESLYAKLESNQEYIIEFLINNGIEAKDIYVSTPTTKDRLAGQYAPERLEYRYSGDSYITVSTSNVEKVQELMKQEFRLIKEGISIGSEYGSGTSAYFEFTDLNKIKPEMVEEATRNARAVALKFAEDSESDLGSIKRASQGQFSITSDDTTPQIKNIRVVTTIDYALE